jgi:hypothetical protein
MGKFCACFAFILLLSLVSGSAGAQTITDCLQGGTTQVLAPWYCSQINMAVAGVWASWEPVALMAVILSFMVAAIMIMFGIALRNEKLRNFGIAEIYEAAASAIMVVAFLTLSATLFGILPSFVTGPVNPYALSLNYISSSVEAAQGTVKSMYDIIMIDSYYGSQGLKVVIGTGSSAKLSGMVSGLVSPLASMITSLFIIPAETMMGLILEGMLALYAEFYIILFFMYVAIPVFLVPGIIFRAILPLRAIGGMMMAMAISFYLVMPILFSVSFFLTNTSVIAQLNSATATMIANGQGTMAQTNAASEGSSLVQAVSSLQSTMGGFFLSVLFYPSLILAMTYFSMQTLEDFIGGISKATGRMALL